MIAFAGSTTVIKVCVTLLGDAGGQGKIQLCPGTFGCFGDNKILHIIISIIHKTERDWYFVLKFIASF